MSIEIEPNYFPEIPKTQKMLQERLKSKKGIKQCLHVIFCVKNCELGDLSEEDYFVFYELKECFGFEIESIFDKESATSIIYAHNFHKRKFHFVISFLWFFSSHKKFMKIIRANSQYYDYWKIRKFDELSFLNKGDGNYRFTVIHFSHFHNGLNEMEKLSNRYKKKYRFILKMKEKDQRLRKQYTEFLKI